MQRRVPGVAAALITAVGAAACGSSGSGSGGSSSSGGDRTTAVKVGVIPIVDVAPLYLGPKKGFFDSRGIKLQTVSAQGGAAIIPGVVSGQFQFGFSNTTSLMPAQVRGIGVKSVANGAASNTPCSSDRVRQTDRRPGGRHRA